MSKSNEIAPEDVEGIILCHVCLAVSAGIVPLPVVDIAAVTGIQANMIREIAALYDEPFMKETAVTLLTSIAGKTLLRTAGPQLISSLAKAIPIIGQTAGMLSMPVLAGASTYAIGKTFQEHFASGGTFASFDANAMHGYYEEKLQGGQHVAARIRKKVK